MKLFAINSPPPHKRARGIEKDGSDNVNSAFIVEQNGNHFYEVKGKTFSIAMYPSYSLQPLQ